jgi:DNA-binding NtrC family response regulator
MRAEPADLIGRSSIIGQLREEIRFAAQCDAKVLVTGESGTGKGPRRASDSRGEQS